MKLSENTLSVLKNFASINSGVVLRAGNVQRTIAPDKAIFVEATLEDSFPNEFGLYELNQFLGNISTLGNPELTFSNKSVIMDDGEVKLKYHSAAVNTIITPPESNLALRKVDVTFSLPNEILQKLLRLAAMNSLPHFSIVGKDGGILLQVHNKDNDNSNVAAFRLNDYTGDNFIITYMVDNIKFIPGDYDAEVQIGAFTKFTSSSGTNAGKIKYFIVEQVK